MFLRLALFCAMVTPAFADCVSFRSFAKGVEVRLEDGSVWLARRDAHEVIRLDQTNAAGPYAKYVQGPYGVYPTESTRNGVATVSEFAYARVPPQPFAGMDWTSNATASNTSINMATADTRREKVHVTAGAVQVVKIGKCSYQVLGVDMGHLNGPNPTVQHFVYFPDLRFGIQTKISYAGGPVKQSGIVRMGTK